MEDKKNAIGRGDTVLVWGNWPCIVSEIGSLLIYVAPVGLFGTSSIGVLRENVTILEDKGDVE